MEQNYAIDQIAVNDTFFHVLKRDGSNSFIAQMANDPKRKHDAELILRTITRVMKAGLDWAFSSETLKPLHGAGPPPLYELRCAKTLRLMVYLHQGAQGRTPVFLFEFEGHKASKSRGGISKKTLQRGEKLARVASELMLAREEENNGKPELGVGRVNDNS